MFDTLADNFREIYAIIAAAAPFGAQGEIHRFNPGGRGPQNGFWLALALVAARFRSPLIYLIAWVSMAIITLL